MEILKKIFEEFFNEGYDLAEYDEGKKVGKIPLTFDELWIAKEEEIKSIVAIKSQTKKYRIRRDVLNMPFCDWERYPRNKTVIEYTVEAFNKKFPNASFLTSDLNDKEKEFVELLYNLKKK